MRPPTSTQDAMSLAFQNLPKISVSPSSKLSSSLTPILTARTTPKSLLCPAVGQFRHRFRRPPPCLYSRYRCPLRLHLPNSIPGSAPRLLLLATLRDTTGR